MHGCNDKRNDSWSNLEVSKRFNAQPLVMDMYLVKNIGKNAVEETVSIKKRYRKFRNDKKAEEEMQKAEIMEKKSVKENEIIQIIMDLQNQVKELNGLANLAFEKLMDKENENKIIQENIKRIREIYDKEQQTGCNCQVF